MFRDMTFDTRTISVHLLRFGVETKYSVSSIYLYLESTTCITHWPRQPSLSNWIFLSQRSLMLSPGSKMPIAGSNSKARSTASRLLTITAIIQRKYLRPCKRQNIVRADAERLSYFSLIAIREHK